MKYLLTISFSRILPVFLCALFLAMTAKADVKSYGCVQIYDNELCQSENYISFRSAQVNWSVTKDEMNQRLIYLWNRDNSGTTVKMANFYLWVNDMNSMVAFRVQYWSENGSLIADLPARIEIWESEIKWRRAGRLPYPLDFGYSVDEFLISCKSECSVEFVNEINQIAKNLTVITEAMVAIQYNNPDASFIGRAANNEVQLRNWFSVRSELLEQVDQIESSPIIEGNGFRVLGLQFIF